MSVRPSTTFFFLSLCLTGILEYFTRSSRFKSEWNSQTGILVDDVRPAPAHKNKSSLKYPPPLPPWPKANMSPEVQRCHRSAARCRAPIEPVASLAGQCRDPGLTLQNQGSRSHVPWSGERHDHPDPNGPNFLGAEEQTK